MTLRFWVAFSSTGSWVFFFHFSFLLLNGSGALFDPPLIYLLYGPPNSPTSCRWGILKVIRKYQYHSGMCPRCWNQHSILSPTISIQPRWYWIVSHLILSLSVSSITDLKKCISAAFKFQASDFFKSHILLPNHKRSRYWKVIGRHCKVFQVLALNVLLI